MDSNQETLKAARRELRTASKAYQRALAKVFSGMPYKEFAEHQRFLKRCGRWTALDTADRIRALAYVCRKRTAEMADLRRETVEVHTNPPILATPQVSETAARWIHLKACVRDDFLNSGLTRNAFWKENGHKYPGMSRTSFFRLMAKVLDGDSDALWDGRSSGGRRQPRVLTDVVRGLILTTLRSAPKQTVAHLTRRVEGKCREEGWPPPSYETVRTFLEGLQATTKGALYGHPSDPLEYYSQNLAPTHQLPYDTGAWQADDSTLDLYVCHRGKDVRPYLTVFVDVESGAILAWAIEATASTAARIARVMLRACLFAGDHRGGGPVVPQTLTVDRGGPYKANAMVAVAKQAKVKYEILVRNPKQKGVVERNIRTIKQDFCDSHPHATEWIGTTKEAVALRRAGELMSLKQLRAEFELWVRDYNARPHSRRPQQSHLEVLSQRSDLVPKAPVDLAGLAGLAGRTRKVLRTGIKIVRNKVAFYYNSSALTDLIGRSVTCAESVGEDAVEVLHPDDLRWIHVPLAVPGGPTAKDIQQGSRTAFRRVREKYELFDADGAEQRELRIGRTPNIDEQGPRPSRQRVEADDDDFADPEGERRIMEDYRDQD